MFFRGSRYEYIPDTEIANTAGRTVRYKRMRFIPQHHPRLGEIVREGERPDLLAYRVLADPEQFWRLCDANRVLRPADLTEERGARVGIPGPGE
jgi:hypothetical protein